MTITEQTTVGEVASTVPASVRVFQQFGIDFCCGGGKTLAQVCGEKGIPLEGLLAGVEKAQEPAAASQVRDWNAGSLAVLIDYILNKHHEYLKSEMPRLGSMLAKVIQVHGNNHPESLHPLGKVYGGLKRELEEHMWKEENVLFPLIKQLEEVHNGSGAPFRGMPVGGPIRMMEMEHESAGEALRHMRELTSGYTPPADACNTYRALLHGLLEMEADLHEHIHLENNILFPRAVAL
ncbi:MAG: iron-sulfur cluster repair di-iron protein [Acidobacteria bacterium]|nr:iron-sulfur cluster repair di-iron protein [Acidobacteriota bacterium]